MRMTISLQSRIAATGIAPKPPAHCAQAWHAAFVLGLLLVGFRPLIAQAPVSAAKSSAGQKPVHRHAKLSAAHPIVSAPETTYAPLAPPAPVWPANDQPVQASIVWDSKGLFIDARNSSLEQILDDVSTATGAKVDGLAADERVFGIYGPGQAREVLSELLQGSRYNVMMIGDQGQGTPRQILLSVRNPGDNHSSPPSRQMTTAAEDEPEPEEPQQPQQAAPAPNRNGFSPLGPNGAPGTPPRTPQQVMEEMQQRQQNQQPPNPQN